MKRKRFLAACLTAALLLGLLPASAADGGAVEIRTAKQLCEFSRSCTLDTWSRGKTVTLAADIDLTGVDFAPVPTFGGVFDGGGHTVSGLSVRWDGSHQGLFRYVQEGAVIRDLKVSGTVAPGGSASAVGGIAGRNYGTIQGCSFSGTASGKNSVGGIVGINEGTGELVSCATSGVVSGEHFTGGIAGQNLGAAVSCVNRAQINTREEEISVSLDELNWEQVNSAENVRAHTDSGGIAGYSTGIIQGCTNYGTVGYPHTGYNVGGIAGRQSGFLDGCTNAGTVYGRKDVGGIAGQLEPYLLLQFSEDSLQKLDGELDTLRSLMRSLGDEAANTGDLIDIRADALTGQLEQVRTGAHDVADWSGDFVDGTVGTVNELSARASRTFDRLEPIFSSLGDTGSGLGDAFRQVSDTIDQIDDSTIWGREAAAEAREAFDRMGIAADDARAAMRSIRDALIALRRNPADQNAMAEARAQLSKAISDLRRALEQLGAAPERLAELLRSLEALGGIRAGDTIDSLIALGQAFRHAAQAAGALWDGMSAIIDGTNGASLHDRLAESLARLREGIRSGGDAMDVLRRAASSLNRSFDNLEILSDELDGVLSGMSDAFSDLDRAMGSMEDSARRMEGLSRELADEPELRLPALNSEYTTTVDNIFDALGGISDEAGGLRRDLRGSGDRLRGTAEAVNDQIGVISDLLMDGYNEILDNDEDKERVEDISDEDDGGSQGHVSNTVNQGTVEGDVDVGGIAGSMAVEYDLDPEDDIIRSGQRSANFRYQTRAVVTACRNEGDITAKKNDAGGIVGRMDLGRVSDCEGYGTVASTDGSYVGGIVGASYSAIRSSWAKCTITGEDHVGGIAGYANDLSGCRALVNIEASGECVGAIAGDAEGVLSQNLFVDDALGAVDGVSYAGQAEAVSYETLLAQDALPDAFRSFTVTFLVDGELYRQETADFDGSLDPVPEVPAREGQFGEWSDENFSNLRANKTVEAVYFPYITVLESEAEQGGKPLALAEGEFDHHASLVLEAAEGAPPGAPGTARRIAVSHSVGRRSGHIVRALAAEDENAVWLAQDGHWSKADSVRDGSYLVFSIDGDEAVFCLGGEANQKVTLLIAAGIALLLAAALLRGCRRRKKRAAAPAKPTEPTSE